MKPCHWCTQIHDGVCSLIKAIEYHENGTIRRIEFKTPHDYMQPLYGAPLYQLPTSNPNTIRDGHFIPTMWPHTVCGDSN